MRQIKYGLLLLITLAVCLILCGCSSGKYMISGTWYSRAVDGTLKWTFTDDGKVIAGDTEYVYEAPARNSFILYSGKDEFPATMEDNVIHIETPNGEIALYKAGHLPEEKLPEVTASEDPGALGVSEEDDGQAPISGTYVNLAGTVTAEFAGTTLTMTSSQGTEPLSTVYEIDYSAPGHIRLVHGREIVDEYDYEQQGDRLIFKQGGAVAMEYLKK